jgi:hypothetical protein
MNWSTVRSAWKHYEKNVNEDWQRLTIEQVRGMLAKREQLSSRVEEAHASSTEESTSS